jgi:hypothetical protein
VAAAAESSDLALETAREWKATLHIRQFKAMKGMGATAVVMMNVSGADPLGTLRLYGEHVLPALRG